MIKFENVEKLGENVEKKSQYTNALNFIKLSANARTPYKATSGAAGMDLYACLDKNITINPGDLVKVPCGIAIEIPDGYGAFIFARSGLGIKYGITLSNGVGVVDSDYRGEVCVGLCNVGKEAYIVRDGERIAQMVILKVENFAPCEVRTLSDTERGEGGFGSTGK